MDIGVTHVSSLTTYPWLKTIEPCITVERSECKYDQIVSLANTTVAYLSFPDVLNLS